MEKHMRRRWWSRAGGAVVSPCRKDVQILLSAWPQGHTAQNSAPNLTCCPVPLSPWCWAPQSKEKGCFSITQFSAPCQHHLEINFSDNTGSQPSTLPGIYLLNWKKNNILSWDGAFGCCREHLEFIGKGKKWPCHWWQWELLLLDFGVEYAPDFWLMYRRNTSPHCWIWSTKIHGPLPSLKIFQHLLVFNTFATNRLAKSSVPPSQQTGQAVGGKKEITLLPNIFGIFLFIKMFYKIKE